MVGKSLSHYKITAELGRGGMGIVYRAEDTKLDRTVAIKVLPSAALASDDDRARFYREAKAAAQLHHPHIASVFEIDEAVPSDAPHGTEPSPFIAMEYIEGETLHDRIQKGPLKLDEAVRIASQIASGLKAAHAKDIVHRDIKSGNIMLTEEGDAKILDFGLAQTAASTKLTRMGSTLGTVAYMSPEQARGEAVDLRTDLWSLGAVLYEMIAGRSPFPGDYEQAVVYEILNQDPDPLTAVRTGVPMGLEWIVSKCMAKKTQDRYQNATDLLVDLRNVDLSTSGMSRMSGAISKADPAGLPVANPSGTGEPSLAAAAKKGWPLTALISWGILGIMVGVLATWSLINSPSALVGVHRLSIPVPSLAPVALDTDRSSVAISPDGKRLVYVAIEDGQTVLFLRDLDRDVAHAIPDTRGASSPFFSPDSRELGYFVGNDLRSLRLPSGAATVLATTSPVSRGASWGMENFIVFSTDPNGILRSLTGEVVSSLDSTKNEYSHRWPDMLPNNRGLLYTVDTGGDFDNALIAVLDLQTGSSKILIRGGTQARFAHSGHIVYAKAGALYAVPFDPDRLQIGSAEAVMVQDSILMEPGGVAHFSISDNGTLVYVEGPAWQPSHRLVWVSRNGNAESLSMPLAEYEHPRISKDGRSLAVVIREGSNYDIWVSRDIERGTLDPVTRHPQEDVRPIWTGDGRLVIASEQSGTAPRIHLIESTGITKARPVLTAPANGEGFATWPGSVSKDGNLAYTEHYFLRSGGTGTDILVLPINGENEPEVFVNSEFDELMPAFSPDGTMIAYVSNERGDSEVYIKRYPVSGQHVRISTDGGTEPLWDPSGTRLFYRNGYQMMEVTVSTEPILSSSSPALLFEEQYKLGRLGRNYDISTDGQRFLMVSEEHEANVGEIRVVLNWFEELNRLVPTSN